MANIWKRPVDDVTSVLLSVLAQPSPQQLWAEVKRTDTGCLEFVMAQQGLQQWRQQLCHQGLPPLPNETIPVLTAPCLWELQSGYELCHRWAARAPKQNLSRPGAMPHQCVPFVMPVPSIQPVINALLTICDGWTEITSQQLVHHALVLVSALEKCMGQIPPTSPDSKLIFPWIQVTQIVLKELLHNSWGYQLCERF